MRHAEAFVTPRLSADRVRFPHVHWWAALFRNPDVTASDARVWTADRIAKGFARQLFRWETLGLGYWVFTLRADGRFVGIAGLRDRPEGVELGYAVLPEFRRRGMATEMARGVLGVAPPARVFARTRLTHAASRRVLEKVGFKFEAEGWEDGTPQALYRWRP